MPTHIRLGDWFLTPTEQEKLYKLVLGLTGILGRITSDSSNREQRLASTLEQSTEVRKSDFTDKMFLMSFPHNNPRHGPITGRFKITSDAKLKQHNKPPTCKELQDNV